MDFLKKKLFRPVAGWASVLALLLQVVVALLSSYAFQRPGRRNVNEKTCFCNDIPRREDEEKNGYKRIRGNLYQRLDDSASMHVLYRGKYCPFCKGKIGPR